MNFFYICICVSTISIISGCTVAQSGAHSLAKEAFAKGSCNEASKKIKNARSYAKTSPEMESDFKKIEDECSNRHRKFLINEKKKEEKEKRLKIIEEEKSRFEKTFEIEAKKGKNANDSILLRAVKENPEYIRYIINPSEKVQLEALRIDPDVMIYIKNPTKKVIQFMQ